MREGEDASLTVAASAVPWETLAVVPSVLPEALTERPALVRAPVSGASRRASVSAQRARASEGARDTRPKGRDRAAGSAG